MVDVRELVVEALIALDTPAARAKDVLDGLRERVPEGRDRGLLTEIVYGVARRWGTLDAILATVSKTPLPELDPAVRAALRAGLYPVLFLDRIPPFAAVDGAVEAAKKRTNPRLAGYVNGVLRGLLRALVGPATGAENGRCDVPRPGTVAMRFSRPLFPDPAKDLPGSLGARYAHPPWLVARWLERFGPSTTRGMLEAGCSRPPLSLRAHPGRRDEVLAALLAARVDARAGAGPDEVVAPDGEAAALAVVRQGLAAVQDGTAQRVAPLAAPRAGQRILDLCAAPGGKTLHLLDLLGDAGEVVACDVDPAKVASLAAVLAARPAGGATAQALEVPFGGPLPFAPATFDAVIVDAPCSNTGVLRRRPEVRRRLLPADVANLATIQARLLEGACALVRPGGRLVYATCSVEPEENEARVAALRAAHPALVRGEGFDVLPTVAADGGFAASFTVPA